MKYFNKSINRIFLLTLIGLLIGTNGEAQQLSYTVPQDFYVCDTALVSITLENTTGSAMVAPAVTITLPAGVTYVAGSITGGFEQNISNLEMPILGLQNIAVGASKTILLSLFASCSLYDDINSGASFTNEIAAIWQGGNDNITTIPYKIETPLLVIANQTNGNVYAGLGEMVFRAYTIRNNRLGALQSFIFRDEHPMGGFDISATPGTAQLNTGTDFVLELTGVDFQGIGDGDALFELDEEITIIEKLTVTDCGLILTKSESFISVTWGCGTETCQLVPGYAKLNLIPVNLNPNIKLNPIYHIPVDYCGQFPTYQALVIQNTGNGMAKNATISLGSVGSGPNNEDIGAIDIATISMDSAGVVTPVIPTMAEPDTLSDCLSGTYYDNVQFVLPYLAPGAQVTVHFGLFACSNACITSVTSFGAAYFLEKECPQGTLMDDTISYADADVFYSTTNVCIKEPLRDDQIYTMQYVVGSSMIHDSTGILHIDFRLPCGMTWDPANDFTPNGHTALASGTYQDVDTTVYWYEFQLPFSLDEVIEPFNIRWDCDAPCRAAEPCLYFFANANCPMGCDADPDSMGTVKMRIISKLKLEPYVMDGCELKYCTDFDFVVDCADSCVVQVDGVIEQDLAFNRISYGLPDNDDNRFADASGDLDLSKIRRDRVMAGDTTETVVHAAVHALQPGASFENAYMRLYFESHTVDIGYQMGGQWNYNTASHIATLSSELEFYDASTGQTYTCNLPQPEIVADQTSYYSTVNVSSSFCIDTFDTNYYLYFNYDVSPAQLAAAGCPVPANLEFEEGDSLRLKVRHRFVKNPFGSGIFNFRVRSFASIFNGYEPPLANHSAPPQDFSCSCPHKIFQFSTVYGDLTHVKIYTDPCLPSDYVTQQRLFMKLGMGNFFPYEFRPLGLPDTLIQKIESPVSLLETRFQPVLLQDGPVVISDVAVPFSSIGENYTLDASGLPAMDEGYSIQLYQKFGVPCYLNQLKSLEARAAIRMEEPLIDPVGEFYVMDTISNALNSPILPPDTFGFIPTRPFLFASGVNLDYISFNNLGEWIFNLVHSGGNLPAYNAYFYVESPTGLLTNFQLFLMPGNVPVPLVNGVFQLGDVPAGAVQTLRLVCSNNSCQKELLTGYFGWNCSQYTDKTAQACSKKTIAFAVKAQKAELELDLVTPSAVVELCDTSAFHEAKVFNALYGTAYSVHLQVNLPPGLVIVPASCQISYPTGSAWTALPLPNPVGSGFYDWDLSALNSMIGQNGLAGFNSAPLNSATVRFRTIPTCGFTNGDQIIYKTFAFQNCSDSTNVLVKPGEPILLNGVPLPYSAQLDVTSETPLPIGCNDELTVRVELEPDAMTQVGDSLMVLLPPGAEYVVGSYQPVNNAVSLQPNVSVLGAKTLLKWPLLSSLPAHSAIYLTFKAANFGSQGCGVLDTILVYSVQNQTAICTADGSICSSNAVTAQDMLIVAVNHPSFEVLDFDVDFDAGIAGFHVDLKNTASFLHTAPTTIKFYRDTDHSGTLTPGDVLKYQQTIFFPIGPGNVVPLSGGLPIDLSDICHLIVVLEAADMCMCADVAFSIDDIRRTILPKIVCSGAFIDIGLPSIPGHHYLWTPPTAISCDTCSAPMFNFTNPGDVPIDFQYVFSETAGDCTVLSDVSVSVLPAPHILSQSPVICAGDPVVLTATAAVNYYWSGEGITDPTAAQQTVYPTFTGIYSVTLTDAAGCQGSDTLHVTVRPSPVAQIGADTLGVCGNEQLQFNAFYDPAYQFQWSPASAVSNASIHNPVFVATQNTLLTLTVSLPNGCVRTDQVFVGFSQNPTVQISAIEAEVCLGDTAIIELTGASDYEWQPSLGVQCLAPDCGVAAVFPAQNQVFIIVGSNAFGCKDTVGLSVLVPGTVKHTAESISICAGETVQVFGNTVSTAGVFSKIFQTAQGCDSTHTVSVTLLMKDYLENAITLCPGDSVVFEGVTIHNPGSYCQSYVNQNGCDSTLCLVVDLGVSPVLDTFYRVLVAEGDSVQLQLPDGFEQYLWVPDTYLSCADCPDPWCIPGAGVDSLVYSVAVTNAEGCVQRVSYHVQVLPQCDPGRIIIPNTFTPDGDQVNDVFGLTGIEGFERVVSLVIYNRWGEKVFEGSGLDAVWDGMQDSKQATSDIYVYIFEIACGELVSKRVGDVFLLR